MSTRLHSLKFALEQTWEAHYNNGHLIVKAIEHRTGGYTLDIGSNQSFACQSIDEVETHLQAFMPEYVKGSRVWEDIGD